MQADEEKKREERRKLLACKKELEDAWRKKECARLEFDTNELKSYMSDLYNYWDEETSYYRREIFKDSVDMFNIITPINEGAKKEIKSTEKKRVWDSYVNSPNAANEDSMIITANDFIHLAQEIISVEPEPNDIEELKLRITKVDKTDSFLEIHPNLFEMYISLCKECITLFNKITSMVQKEKCVGLIQYCQQKPVGILHSPNDAGNRNTILTEANVDYDPSIIKNEIGSEVAETIVRDTTDPTGMGSNGISRGTTPRYTTTSSSRFNIFNNDNGTSSKIGYYSNFDSNEKKDLISMTGLSTTNGNVLISSGKYVDKFSINNDEEFNDDFGNKRSSNGRRLSTNNNNNNLINSYSNANLEIKPTLRASENGIGNGDITSFYNEIKSQFRVLFLQLLDKATKYAIQHPTMLGGTDIELELQRSYDLFSFGLWSNPQRNVRKRTLQFNNMGVTIHLSKQISVSSLALRIIMVDCDLFESETGTPLGFTGLISLLGIPPQPAKSGLWVVESSVQKTSTGMPIYLHHLPYPLKSSEYPVKYPGCYWENEENVASPTPRTSQASTAGQSITIDIALSVKNVMPSNPIVAMWGQDQAFGQYGWTNDDIELFYTPEKRLISFTTTRIGPLAIISRPGASIPYINWSIKPLFMEDVTSILSMPDSDTLPEKELISIVSSLKQPPNVVRVVVLTLELQLGLKLTIVIGEKGACINGIPLLEKTLFGTVSELCSAAKATGISLEPGEADASTCSKTACSSLLEEVFATQLALLVCLPRKYRVVDSVIASEWNKKLPVEESPAPDDTFYQALNEFEKVNKESKGWIDPEAPVKKKKKAKKSKKNDADAKANGAGTARSMEKKKPDPEEEERLGDGPLGYTPVHVTRCTDAFDLVKEYCSKMRSRLGKSDILEEGSIFQLKLLEGVKITAIRDVVWPPAIPPPHEQDPIPTKAMADAKLHEPPPRNRNTRGGNRNPKQRQREGLFRSLKDASIMDPLPTSEFSTPEIISARYKQEECASSPTILLGRCDDRLAFRVLPVPEKPNAEDKPCVKPAPGTKPTGTIFAMFGISNPGEFVNEINDVVAVHLKELLYHLRIASFG